MNKVILVGHSFGGRVAIRIASQKGYLLDKIVLVDSAGLIPRRGLKYYFKIYVHKLMMKLNIPHNAGSDDYRKLNGVLKQTFKNVVNEDLGAELNKVTLPVLLIWGSKDKDTPIYMARRMKRRMPDSALIIFEAAGHYSYLDRYGLFVTILRNFLAGGEYEVDSGVLHSHSGHNGIVKIPMHQSK